MKRNFTANKPGQKWVGDITYIPTWEGFTYLATVMDCYPKKIIGYAIAGNMRTQLITEALHMAVRNCPVTRGETVFHSGAWFTLASQLNCAEVMDAYGIRASVGRTGSCYDNAAAESFNTLLQERGSKPEDLPNTETRHKGCDSLDRVAAAITKRLHSALGYQTPNHVHQEWSQNQTAA